MRIVEVVSEGMVVVTSVDVGEAEVSEVLADVVECPLVVVSLIVDVSDMVLLVDVVCSTSLVDVALDVISEVDVTVAVEDSFVVISLVDVALVSVAVVTDLVVSCVLVV